MAIIMMAMGKKVTPPGILAEKFFGDEGKKPMVLMPVMAAWGAIFGALVASGTLAAGYVSGFIVAG
ncbi:hypothetical protein HYV82_06345, partial [Candidatus Woesearchaeota archaeon]|nr:hypothetical protein [Candidatus Woesearchaeota archaeon]